jgi:hypothetical protein
VLVVLVVTGVLDLQAVPAQFLAFLQRAAAEAAVGLFRACLVVQAVVRAVVPLPAPAPLFSPAMAMVLQAVQVWLEVVVKLWPVVVVVRVVLAALRMPQHSRAVTAAQAKQATSQAPA